MAIKNRKEIEDLIYKVFDALDPTGVNTEKYKSFFSSMNDKEFEKYMKEFLDDDMENFVFDMVDFERDLNMNNIEKAADILKVPISEYIFMPSLTMNKNKIVSSTDKCIVGYANIKRLQQLVMKKNGLSVDNSKISSLTGQVIDKDKNSRDSDIESEILVSLGADKILQELNGARSDDHVMKREMNNSIATKGYVALDELTNDPTNKTTLSTVNAFLLSMHVKSDLISDSYILPKTTEMLL